MTGKESERFDRLPPTDADRDGETDDDEHAETDDDGIGEVGSRPSREAVVSWWAERFGISTATFAEHTFWERGAGKVWAFRGEMSSPVRVQGLGMHVLRTGGEHWKPTTNAVQRFGTHATRNVIVLEPDAAAAFVGGDDQVVDWDGDWGYLIVAREIAGSVAPLGVGLFIDDELRSQVPKGRRRDL